MKKTTVSILLLACYLFAADPVFAQADTVAIKGFKAFESEPVPEKQKIDYKGNAIKLNLLFFTAGKYGVSFERQLNNTIGVELELGATGRNFLGFALAKEFEGDPNNNQDSPNFDRGHDIPDEDYDFNGRKSTIGYYVGFMPRIYYNNKGFDGNYFGINVQYRHYTFDANDVKPDVISQSDEYQFDKSAPPIDEFENNLIAGFTWGHQGLINNTLLDFNISTGIKSISGERRDIGLTSYPDGFGGTYTVVNCGPQPRSITRATFYLEFCFKIGYGW